jgi:hypothetical protein
VLDGDAHRRVTELLERAGHRLGERRDLLLLTLDRARQRLGAPARSKTQRGRDGVDHFLFAMETEPTAAFGPWGWPPK